MDELGQAIGNRIHGKWKVLLTDACHSGAITPEDDTAQVNKSLLDLNSSMFSLTASRDREQSFESSQWGGGHGIFTYYVIQGLQGEADTSGDGVVTADELAEYVHTNVRAGDAYAAKSYFGSRQLRSQHGACFQPRFRGLRRIAPVRIAPGNCAMEPSSSRPTWMTWRFGLTVRAWGFSRRAFPSASPG